MKKTPPTTRSSEGQASAGRRKLHPMYLYEVKKPSNRRGPGTTTSCEGSASDQAFRHVDKGDCPLVTAQK